MPPTHSRNDRLARILIALYPVAWRERYGDEFVALLEQQPLRPLAVLDIVASALAERAVSVLTVRSDRARALVRGGARFALTIALIAGGISISSVLAMALTALPWRAERGEFAIPAFLVAAQTIWLQIHYSRHRHSGPLRTQPPLGPLTSKAVAVVWSVSIAILTIAKWIQWTSAPAHFELADWPRWFGRMLDDPTLGFFSTPMVLAAAATVYQRWPHLRVGAEPPDVPRHPLGLV